VCIVAETAEYIIQKKKRAFFIFLDKINLSIMSSVVDSDTLAVEKTIAGSEKAGNRTNRFVSPINI